LILLSDHRIIRQHFTVNFFHIQAIALYKYIRHLHTNFLRFQSNISENNMKFLVYVYAVKCTEGDQNWSSTLPWKWI